MTSSQDSDIEVEYERIIKPKKIVPKLINSILIDDCSNYYQDSFREKFTGTKSRLKKIKKQILSDRMTLSPNKKMVRRLPITFNVLHLEINSLKQKIFEQKYEGLNPTSQDPTCQSNSFFNKKEYASNLNFIGEETQKSYDDMKNSGLLDIDSANKKINNSKNIQEKLRQNATLIYSSRNRNRTQIIKQFRRGQNKIRTYWDNNLINGYTQIDYEDKGKFRGIFQQGQIISGQMTFSNGFIYTGQFTMFVFHGLGKLRFPSGQQFEGNWLLGSLNGNGKIIYPKGQIYIGQISDFKRDGEGYLYFKNGDKYTGQFIEGQITGYGELHKDGICTHKGFWIDGKFIGNQKQTYLKKRQQNQKMKKKEKKNTDISQSLIESLKQIKQFHQLFNQSIDKEWFQKNFRQVRYDESLDGQLNSSDSKQS